MTCKQHAEILDSPEQLIQLIVQPSSHICERVIVSLAQESPLWVQLLHPISVLIGVSEKEVKSRKSEGLTLEKGL